MKTPLFDEHIKLNSKMTQFAGWEMPLYYSGIVNEVNAVRTAAGIFDLSHMGELIVNGKQSLELLQYLTTNDVSRLKIGYAQYTLLCNENGGILDDLIVYKLDLESYMLVINASNTESDLAWILNHNNFDANCENRSKDTALLALQGPFSQKIMSGLVDFEIASLGRFKIKKGRVGGIESWIAGTGYTGEDGFEIYCASKDAIGLWKTLNDACGKYDGAPVGLAARDVLRLEAGYPLYGNELTSETTPVEAGLMWVVKPAKGEFIGKTAILARENKGSEKVLTGLISEEKCIPRHGNQLKRDNRVIGEITSGTFSPTLGKGIALAYVELKFKDENTAVILQSRGKECACHIAKTPFIK